MAGEQQNGSQDQRVAKFSWIRNSHKKTKQNTEENLISPGIDFDYVHEKKKKLLKPFCDKESTTLFPYGNGHLDNAV